MKIEPATFSNVMSVAVKMRDRDFEEFTAVSFVTQRTELASLLAQRYGGHDGMMCASSEDDPIAIGGGTVTRPNVASLLFFATPRFGEIAIGMTRFILKELFPRLRQQGVHRIEAVSIDGYGQSHRWLQTLGMAPEGPPMKGYGKDGQAFQQFAWVGDVLPPAA